MIAQRGDTLTFKGNGYTISNVNFVSGANDNTTGQAAMFYAYPNSTLNVSELTLEKVTVNAEQNGTGYAAAVVGYCEGTANLTNVDVVDATIVGVKSSGALVGHLSGSLNATDCDVSGTVTLADFAEEANGHYAGKYIGTMAGATALNNCTANVTVSGNLNAANIGDIYGRKTAAGTLTIDGAKQEKLTSENYATTTITSNTMYALEGDFGGKNVALTMAVGVENVVFDGSNATGINELIITQNGALIDNATTPVGTRSGNVTVQNFNVLSQINVFACKTEVVVQKNTAEALMIYAGNCDVKVLNNIIDVNFESHPTYRNATQTWNTNNYGIALNIFDYNLWLDGNTVTDATGHAIGINGWEGTIDNGDENVIESFKGNTITVNSTTNTKRAAFKVWDDETYASNDDDTSVVNATAQAFINAVLADGSNTFNIVDGYDHTIFSFYSVNTNN